MRAGSQTGMIDSSPVTYYSSAAPCSPPGRPARFQKEDRIVLLFSTKGGSDKHMLGPETAWFAFSWNCARKKRRWCGSFLVIVKGTSPGWGDIAAEKQSPCLFDLKYVLFCEFFHIFKAFWPWVPYCSHGCHLSPPATHASRFAASAWATFKHGVCGPNGKFHKAGRNCSTFFL